MTRYIRLSTLCVLLLPQFCTTAVAGEVRFDGTNVMQGEFKKLERGQVYFKTPATETITIDLDHVDSISTTKNLEIELDSGEILYGTVDGGNAQGQLIVRSPDGTTDLQLVKIVRISEMDDKVVDRFSGSATIGLNLTKVNNYQSYSFGTDLTYTMQRYVSNIDASYRLNRSDDSPQAEQWSVQINSGTKWKKRRYTGGVLNFFSNKELGVDLRSSIGISLGKDFVSSNSRVFHMDAGLLYTKEDITDSVNTNYSTEAFVGARIDLFRYDVPKLDFTAELVAIPSLTQKGRIRTDGSVSMSWEMIKDLYWLLTYSGNYDSHPPEQDSSNDDYSLYSGLQYKF